MKPNTRSWKTCSTSELSGKFYEFILHHFPCLAHLNEKKTFKTPHFYSVPNPAGGTKKRFLELLNPSTKVRKKKTKWTQINLSPCPPDTIRCWVGLPQNWFCFHCVLYHFLLPTRAFFSVFCFLISFSHAWALSASGFLLPLQSFSKNNKAFFKEKTLVKDQFHRFQYWSAFNTGTVVGSSSSILLSTINRVCSKFFNICCTERATSFCTLGRTERFQRIDRFFGRFGDNISKKTHFCGRGVSLSANQLALTSIATHRQQTCPLTEPFRWHPNCQQTHSTMVMIN